MSRGQGFASFNSVARGFLTPDVGPVEDEDCGVANCEDGAVYRVPWPQFGGDVAYCPFHLARYRDQYPDIFERVQAAVDEDLTALATRGQRWLSIEEVPVRIRQGRYRRVGVTARGFALFEATEPDEDGQVTYVLVDRNLDYRDAIQVSSEQCGAFLEDFDDRRGFFEWDQDVLEALRGGEVQ